MLTQSFKTADELDLSNLAYEALHKVLVLFETGQINHVSKATYSSREYVNDASFSGEFNMRVWQYTTECGTVACIGGTVELIAGQPLETGSNHELHELCFPRSAKDPTSAMYVDYDTITTPQAAQALRNYLTTGKSNWDDILFGPVMRR